MHNCSFSFLAAVPHTVWQLYLSNNECAKSDADSAERKTQAVRSAGYFL